MAIMKKLHEMTLEEINEQLEFAAHKTYGRVDHARNALKKLVDKGDMIYAGKGAFYEGAKVAKVEKAEKAEKKTKKAEKKTKKAEKKTKKVFIDDPNHKMIGQKVFTRFGTHSIKKIGHYEGNKEKLKAVLSNGKEIALNSCRTSAVDPEYRDRYPVDHEHKTMSGKPSIGVEDEITERLKGVGVETLHSVCRENKLDPDRWKHLNEGMQRMCLGNRLRGMARNGHRVTILKHVISEGGMADEKAA